MIVDGQQRLTSLYAVMRGRAVVSEDNDHSSSASRSTRSPKSSLSPMPLVRTMRSGYEHLGRVDGPAGSTPSPTSSSTRSPPRRDRRRTRSEQQIGANLGRLAGLTYYQFSALELSSELDVDEVAEVFVRINSLGVALNSADFILTLMSVHYKEARHQLEDFARAAKKPSTTAASPYNVFHAPSPDQLLRVAVGLGLQRGVLQNAYHVLRGRDPVTKVVSEERREQSFDALLAAQQHVLDLTNWHDYLVAVKRAGYRSGE